MQDRNDSMAALLPRIRQLQAARDHRGVVEALRDVLPSNLLAEPAIGYALAVSLRALGRADDASELAEALREPCARRGRDRLYRQRLNLEAALAFEEGRHDRARELWQDLLNEATGAEDSEMVAKASNNLGILHTLGDRSWEAVTAYTRALAASKRLGDRRGLAQAHQNLAITFREAGRAREADAHFQEAVSHATASRGIDVLGRAEEERALLLLLEGDPGMAEASAQRALERLTKAGDAAGAAEALRVLGLVSLSLGRTQEARSRLDEALDGSRTVGNRLLEAETLAALEGVSRLEDRPAEADTMAAAAEEIFQELGAPGWGERARARVDTLLSA